MGKEKRNSSSTWKVRISTSAAKDIDEITMYIAIVNQQPINAVKVGDAIFDLILKIEQNPFVFKECEAMLPKQKIIGKPLVYHG